MMEEIKELLIKWHCLITFETEDYHWRKEKLLTESAIVLIIDWRQYSIWYRTPNEYYLCFPDLPTMKEFLIKEIAKAQ